MKKRFSFKKLLCCLLGACFIFFTACGDAGKGPDNDQEKPVAGRGGMDFTRSQLMGADALGRTIAPNTGDNGKYVGIFTNVNNSETGNMNKIYDISKLLDEYGSYNDWREKNPSGSLDDFLKTNPVLSRDNSQYDGFESISPNGKFHWYAEPLYGYYSNCDPWVLKRQLELLGLMGVDYLLLDLSNYPFMFTDSMHAMLTAIKEMQEAGNVVPKAAIMFSVSPPYSKEMLDNAISSFISKKEYDNVWFRGDKNINPSGGPLMVGKWATTQAEDYPDIWLKEMQWPTDPYDNDALSWMDWADRQHNHNGTMNVSAAQHINGTWSSAAYVKPENGKLYHGRGWTYGDPTTGYDEAKVMSGANFQQQWDWAISQRDALNMVLVTGWNEWAVRKLGVSESSAEYPKFKYAPFVDEFSLAYSRETEMMFGGYGDNYAFQLAMNIRRFKGKSEDSTENAVDNEKKTVSSVTSNEWISANAYCDAVGEVFERNAVTGQKAITYKDTSNRNDIKEVRILNDGVNLYVKVTCTDKISDYVGGDNWMNLYLSTGKSAGWESFDFLVNAQPDNGITSVHSLTSVSGTKTMTKRGEAHYVVAGDSIMFTVLLSDLGLSAGDIVGVKATDNVCGEGSFRKMGTAEDFYLTGDSAPVGRFAYCYKIA